MGPLGPIILDYKYTNVDLFFTKSESKRVELTIQKFLVWFGKDNFSTHPSHTVVTVLYNLLMDQYQC